MPVDAEQWRAEIGNFNGCLHYAVIKLKLKLFHIMTNVSQVLVFLLAILLSVHFKRQYYLLLFNIFCIYHVTCCLRTHTYTICLCFKFRHLTKLDSYFP